MPNDQQQQEQVLYMSACPHRPSECLSGFKCPFFASGQCHVADGFNKDGNRSQVNASYWYNAPWTISSAMKSQVG